MKYTKIQKQTYSQAFFEYLTENEILEFTTKECVDWYQFNKLGSGLPYYPNIYLLIINPLLQQGLIHRLYQGRYRTGPAIYTQDSALPRKPQIEQNNKDDEFFAYIAKKIKSAKEVLP